jgi:hypothetical protein
MQGLEPALSLLDRDILGTGAVRFLTIETCHRVSRLRLGVLSALFSRGRTTFRVSTPSLPAPTQSWIRQ